MVKNIKTSTLSSRVPSLVLSSEIQSKLRAKYDFGSAKNISNNVQADYTQRSIQSTSKKRCITNFNEDLILVDRKVEVRQASCHEGHLLDESFKLSAASDSFEMATESSGADDDYDEHCFTFMDLDEGTCR